MQKLLNQTKKLFLFLSICIGSLTFTTQAQIQVQAIEDFLKEEAFLSCKDTSKSIDKSLRDVVINTVKAADLASDLEMYLRSFDVLIRDRACVMQKLDDMKLKTETTQVMGIASELTYRGWLEEDAFEQNLKMDNGFCTDFYYRSGQLPKQPNRSKCNELKDQLLKPKYSLEQTSHSQTWTQDFLGGITDMKKIDVRDLFTHYKVYLGTHKSNPDSVYIFIIIQNI